MGGTVPLCYSVRARKLVVNEAEAALGVKGAGELTTNGAPAALANAVKDALAADGAAHVELPMTAERVWRALRPAGAAV